MVRIMFPFVPEKMHGGNLRSSSSVKLENRHMDENRNKKIDIVLNKNIEKINVHYDFNQNILHVLTNKQMGFGNLETSVKIFF
jgi:hypothetical protein